MVPMITLSRSSKVLLVADLRGDPPVPGAGGSVRRYRLARLRVAPPSPGASAGPGHPSHVRP